MNANERLCLLRVFVKLQLCFRAAAFCSSRRYTTWTVQKRLPKKSRTSDVADLRRSITETEPRSWARQKLHDSQIENLSGHTRIGESQLESNGEDNHPWLSIAKSADCQMRLTICSVNVFIRSIMIEDKP
ncbi:predicted protein [Histoplasma capsulatum G186AR]|uniref:Secreted protein n=1 Tax=Ajellomyces capsulatus (strain G186AR / H82 / ATCC MYA-2454 / RMSCC 2432) TaxID=447093 RepID=C0NI04_AJECG|nr:uncharacterized protein HCBG_02976 [Histoplasma capsulatum G186AR]EEH09439.1 predicted protein [Histoplasma capsulatum G186AR]